MSALAEIAALRSGRARRHAPGVRAPTRLALWQARGIVQAAIGRALTEEREWSEPTVAPRADGGVDLEWTGTGRLLLCTVPAADESGVWIRAVRMTRDAAVQRIVRALPPLMPGKPPPAAARARAAASPAPVYPDAEIRALREAYQAGASARELAIAKGMNRDWVRDVVHGRKRRAAGGPIAGLEEGGPG
jgi:hypothetical protein